MEEKRSSKRIPKVIHFIWFGDKMPWYIQSYIEMTRQKYPEFEIKIWGEKEFDPNSTTYTKKAYEQQKWAFISDYLRVKILYEEGGIYLDTDMVPMGDMRPLLRNAVVIGWEYNKLISTGFTAATPGHPLFKKILETYDSFDNRDEEFKFLVNNELWSYVLKSGYGLSLNGQPQHLIGDIKIYPQTYFAEGKICDDQIYLHDHKLSWTSPTKQKVMKFGLSFVRKFQKQLSVALSAATWIQFRSNKKAVNKMTKEVKDENTKDIKG